MIGVFYPTGTRAIVPSQTPATNRLEGDSRMPRPVKFYSNGARDPMICPLYKSGVLAAGGMAALLAPQSDADHESAEIAISCDGTNCSWRFSNLCGRNASG